MTICTRILYARCADPADMERLKATCRAVGKMRAAIWQRWGGLGTIGKTANEVRREITAAQQVCLTHQGNQGLTQSKALSMASTNAKPFFNPFLLTAYPFVPARSTAPACSRDRSDRGCA